MPRLRSMIQNFFPDGYPYHEIAFSPARKVSNIFLIYSSSILFFLFFSIFLTSIGFSLKIPITSYHFFFILPFTLIFVIISCFIFPSRSKLFGTSIMLALLVSSFYLSLDISKHFFDISYDGQAYHQEALIQLDRGWNPFYEQLNNFNANNMDRWLNHYSKGVWVYESIIFKATNDIESAKLFHIWLMIATFLFTLSFLSRFEKLPFILTFLISLLVAFSPVSIYQSLSFYLDGQLMSLMVILIVILGLIYMESNNYYYILLFMTIAVLVNVKLTAGIYTLIIMSGYMVILWMKNKLLELYKVFIFATAAFLIGFLLFGWNPYVTNTIYRGNPLYPALGTDRSDYTVPQFPANFSGKNSIFLLFYSIFSRSDNVRGADKAAYLKIPFTFSKDELKAFTDTNAKQGGFGPLFGGSILLSFLVIFWALITLGKEVRWRHNNKNLNGRQQYGENNSALATLGVPLFCLAVILVTCLINPASSLARFIPQMWLFPIFAFFLTYNSNNKPIRIIGYLIILVLLFNNILIGITYYKYNLEITRLYKDRLEKFATTSKQDPIKFYFGDFKSSHTHRFDKFGINYEIIENKEDCNNGQRILPHSIILKCISN